MFRVKTAKETDSQTWDKVVERSPHGTIFHTWRWLHLVEQHTGTTLHPLMLYKGMELSAIYPLFLEKKGWIRLAHSPPSGAYLLYLGPVIIDYEKRKDSRKADLFYEILQEFDRYIFSHLACSLIRVRIAPGLFDSRPMRWLGYDIEPLYTYRLDLTQGKERIWENFDRKLKVSINRAQRENIEITAGGEEDMAYINGTLAGRFRDQGYEPIDHLGYLLGLYRQYGNDTFRILVARKDGERVGAFIALAHKEGMFLWIGIPKANLKGISPNDLLQWTAIQMACNEGLKYYELMDAGDDPRLRFFKAKYNPSPLVWFSGTRFSSTGIRSLFFFYQQGKKIFGG